MATKYFYVICGVPSRSFNTLALAEDSADLQDSDHNVYFYSVSESLQVCLMHTWYNI